jgi:hypothetical protein
MKTILVALSLLACAGCESQEEQRQRAGGAQLAPELGRISKEIIYFKEHRAGLCYGIVWVGDWHGGAAMSEVPCEKVEGLLVNPLEKD